MICPADLMTLPRALFCSCAACKPLWDTVGGDGLYGLPPASSPHCFSTLSACSLCWEPRKGPQVCILQNIFFVLVVFRVRLVVYQTPLWQSLDLLPVRCSVISRDEPNDGFVISKFNDPRTIHIPEGCQSWERWRRKRVHRLKLKKVTIMWHFWLYDKKSWSFEMYNLMTKFVCFLYKKVAFIFFCFKFVIYKKNKWFIIKVSFYDNGDFMTKNLKKKMW